MISIARTVAVPALSGVHLEAFRRDRLADVHRVERPSGKLADFGSSIVSSAVFRNDVAVDQHPGDADVLSRYQ